MTQALERELSEIFGRLSPSDQRRVVEFAKALVMSQPSGDLPLSPAQREELDARPQAHADEA